MTNVVRPDFNYRYAKNEELAQKIHAVIEEYHNQMSVAEVIGVLDMIKHYLIQAHTDEDE